ncbi:hypothetical protein P8452_34357 [Trifolium repens]|nr:hypothetical protein P8452_34357 [Trifolium repens]
MVRFLMYKGKVEKQAEKQTRRQKLQEKKRTIKLKKNYYERRLAPWRRRSDRHELVNTVVTVAYGEYMHPVVHNIWHDLGDSN